MIETPRTDAARIEMIYDMIYHDNDPYFGLIARADKMEELETELTDMRKQFTEYVKAEDAWRDADCVFVADDLRIAAAKLRKQAMEVLGL